MRTLFSTTALVVTLGFPTLMVAQTATPEQAQSGAEMSGFLAMRGQSDMFASELMGHEVHARRAPADMAATGGNAAMNADGTRSMATMERAELDEMDNIGQINEIVLSGDGQVRAIVIGVGGFLGMGEQDVAVRMDQVTFAADPENRSETYIVVNTGAEMLKDSPAFDRTAMAGDNTHDRSPGTAQEESNRTAFTAPRMQRDGYDQVEVSEVSSEMLVGKSVYGVDDDSVGTVDDLILDDKGAITNVIIDFGGFLGLGTSQVSLGFDELTILANDGRADVRVYVDATKQQIQAQPQYRATN